MLFKKLIRTAGRYKAQFISMIIMTALGIGMFLGFNMEWVSINANTFRFFDETAFADFRVMSEDGFTEKDAETIAGIEGVSSVSRFLAVNADIKEINSKEPESGHVLAVTVTENFDVSKFKLLEGEEYNAESLDGIWLFDRFAEKNDIQIGDEIELSYDSLKFSGKVKGLIESSEYLISIQDETQLMPDFVKYGYCYISPAMLKEAVSANVRSEAIKEIRNTLKDELDDAIKEAEDKLSEAEDAIRQFEDGFRAAGLDPSNLDALPAAMLPADVRAMISQFNEIKNAYSEGAEELNEMKDKAASVQTMSEQELSDLIEEYTDDTLEGIIKDAQEEASEKIYHQINVISDLDKADFKDAVNDAIGKTLVVLTRDENVSYAESQGEAEEGKTMGSILPVLFLLISVLTMVTTMHRIATNEKTQIGILKALGFKDCKILLHYSCYTLMIGVLGSVLGIALGYLVCWIIMNPNGMMGTYLSMPYWDLFIPWWCWIIVAAVIVLMLVIGMASTRKMMKGTAADALKPYVPTVSRQMLIEKTKVWDKWKFGTKWNLRDIMRHKSRSAVTLIGVIGCMVLMVGAIGMYETANAFVDLTYSENARYSSRAFVSSSVEEEDALKLAEKYDGDYSASISVQMNDETYSLDIYHIENDLVRFMDENNNEVVLPDNGAYVCLRIADKYSLKAGDVVKVSPFGTNDEYELIVLGTIRSMTESIYISDEYAQTLISGGKALTESDQYRIGSIYTLKEKGEINEEQFSAVQSKADIAESMDSFMEILNTFVIVLVLAAIILGIVVLYNLGVMSYTERYREMATLKVVGFKNRKLKSLLIGQNMWLTVIGIILGFGAGYGVLTWLMIALAPEYEMKVIIGGLTVIVSVAVTFAVSLVVGVMVSGKIKKVNMVEALKMPE